MSDIHFDEDQEFKRSSTTNEKPYFVRLVLSTGIVSTDEQANYVLLGLAVFLIIIAFAIPMLTSTSGGAHMPPEKVQQIMNLAS